MMNQLGTETFGQRQYAKNCMMDAPCWRPVGKKPPYMAAALWGLPQGSPSRLEDGFSWSNYPNVAGKTLEEPWIV